VLRKLKLAAARRVNFTVRKQLNGTRYKLPILGGIGARMRQDYEPWMVQTLIDLERSTTGCLVDVGMNLGQTLLAMKSVRTDWEYYGFEPNPACVYYVHQLIEANDLDRCTVYPFGIGGTTGVVDLRTNTVSGGEGSIVEGILPDSWFGRTVKVPIMAADALPSELVDQRWGVLKVDVEDAELEVFRTLTPFIERDQPQIVTELLPTYGAEGGMALRLERQTAVIELLQDLGYQMFRIHLDGSREALTHVDDHRQITWSNYLFVPTEVKSMATSPRS